MVSGKGGVGKTTCSASLALKFAQEGHTTLIVSTDPAHSLSDSLAQDVSGGQPVLLEGTPLPLWGMEINPEKTQEELRSYFTQGGGKDNVKGILSGIPGLNTIMDSLGDLKLGDLLNDPPPGLDEAAAISKVVQFVQKEEYARFSRIVIDTAPTGHTLRLLKTPEFVINSLEKVIKIRQKLTSASDAIRGIFGQSDQQDENILKLKKLQDQVRIVQKLFRDHELMEFVICTIPTTLAIKESQKLLQKLQDEDINIKKIIINQVITPQTSQNYLKTKYKDQERSLDTIKQDSNLNKLYQIQAPVLDLEVRGAAALQYFGNIIWEKDIDQLSQIPDSGRRFILLGGKGGVGKTSCSSSLGVQFAQQGYKTLIVSTDPAHSLSDSLDQDVSGGYPTKLDQGYLDIPLYGLEIDIQQIRKDYKNLTSQNKESNFGINNILKSVGLGGLADQFKDLNLAELLDNPPPGVDESMAVGKVIQLLKSPQYKEFTHVVFDTAPTGHTLRFLSLPNFLQTTLGKVIKLRQILSNPGKSVMQFFGQNQGEKDEAVEKLEMVQNSVEEARKIFRDPKTTEFIIVTIPTQMAVSESSRLASSLKKENVLCEKLVINQILKENMQQSFLNMKRSDQQRAIENIRNDFRDVQIIEGPYLDLEIRGYGALQYFASLIYKDDVDF